MPVFCLCFSARRTLTLLPLPLLFCNRMSSVHVCVRPSMTFVDQDHILCKSWKLITRTITPTPSLFVAQRPSTYFQGNMGKVWEKTGKSGVQEHKSGNISDTRKDRGKVTAYRNSLTLFRTVPSPTPYDLLFLKIVLWNRHPKLQSITRLLGLPQEESVGKGTNFKFCTHSHGIDRNKSPLKMSGTPKNFQSTHIGYRAHRAVIFAIARLSCIPKGRSTRCCSNPATIVSEEVNRTSPPRNRTVQLSSCQPRPNRPWAPHPQ